MPLTEALERLYSRRRFGIKPGVDRVGKLLERLGNPEKQFRTVHVAGTNGKGSTSAFLSSILLYAGHHVAQFSSPHLVRFTERFRIDGKEYPAEKLARLLDIALKAAPDEATFFEITTALGALVFSEERVEFAVMEAGMGGRSDATAAFDGVMTVLTPISLDHTDYLGTTLDAIAGEKAGIIKPGTLVISAKQADPARVAIEEHCRSVHCIVKTLGTDFSAERNLNGTFDYHGVNTTLTELKAGLSGRYQASNAAVALAAAEALKAGGTNISSSALRDGIAKAYWPGRMELIPGTPPLLLDGAHNPAGAVALAEALQEYSYSRLIMVTGVCEDKDFEQIYAPLTPLVDAVYTVTPAIERAFNDEELSRFFRHKGIKSEPCGSVTAGVTKARSEACADDLILVCGSLFVVGEIKAWLENIHYSGIRG
ncbi:MAG: bifunctional folylpolyglutamate synthase/dihydrofolate synthase [Desulfuromonadaceae bacterium]|nr:bifunctional folylpolyglutamate synthase/dihydrofolate synthase [Desulfuromonadaceae bacterium]MDD2849891.1 bifunctional folylpolyglutamate synthase/dihydrofolate synthase [Desulfuromonadaceae bacterium]MDD4130706.1 bifunctional folylpolyglutamate synthase/dihydrofolate synthase [Desulfuromonadaceae bacterium]